MKIARLTLEGQKEADRQTLEQIKGGRLYDNTENYQALEDRAAELADMGRDDEGVSIEALDSFESAKGRPAFITLPASMFEITETPDE